MQLKYQSVLIRHYLGFILLNLWSKLWQLCWYGCQPVTFKQSKQFRFDIFVWLLLCNELYYSNQMIIVLIPFLDENKNIKLLTNNVGGYGNYLKFSVKFIKSAPCNTVITFLNFEVVCYIIQLTLVRIYQSILVLWDKEGMLHHLK